MNVWLVPSLKRNTTSIHILVVKTLVFTGIYGITCLCVGQYSGKTTVTNGRRFGEHWSKSTSVKEHLKVCVSKPTPGDVKVQFLENVWDRGKYSLSEREYLWNKRIKGTINIQKVLSK